MLAFMEEANPKLKALFMEIVEKQIKESSPPEASETFRRLVANGISKSDAKIYIGQAVCVEIWDMMKNGKEFDMERYVRNLHNLPEEPSA